MTTPTIPIRPIRRGWALAAGLGVGAIALLGLAGPAAAVDEFPSNPDATAVASCDPTPGFDYTLTNVNGLSSATFAIDVATEAGTTSTTQEVASNQTTTLHADVPEDTTGTITITADTMETVTLTEDVDCFDAPTAVISTSCGTVGGEVVFALTDDDADPVTEWVITIDGQTFTYGSADELVQYAGIAEGESFDAVVTADGVEVAAQSGVMDCVQPAAVIELACTGAGPDLIVTLHADDTTTTDYEITWPELSREAPETPVDGPVVVTVDPGTDQTFQWPLPREVDYSVSVSAAPDGLVADLTGSSGCSDTEVLSADPIEPVYETPYVAPVDTYVAPGPVGTTELARTGSETPILVALGVTLLGLGIVIVRFGRRMLARPI